MDIFERLNFLARGGRKDYLHTNGKENKKTTDLQDLLDEVSKRATERAIKRLRDSGDVNDHPAMKRLEERFKEIKL